MEFLRETGLINLPKDDLNSANQNMAAEFIDNCNSVSEYSESKRIKATRINSGPPSSADNEIFE